MKFELLPQGMAPSVLPQGMGLNIPPQGMTASVLPQGMTPSALPQGMTPSVLPQGITSSMVNYREDDPDQLSSDGSTKGIGMPIDKLQVYGNQLTQQKTTVSPPASPHPPSTSATLRRYEFIRRSLTRTEKPASPTTFVIEGRQVKHKQQQNGDVSSEVLDENRLDFDPIALLDSRMNPSKALKYSPPKPKSDAVQSVKGSTTSVVLPVLHIEGPGFAHQMRSKSSSLPGDEQPATEMEDMVTEPPPLADSIWSELENLDQRHHRAIKKNNFFTPAGARIGEDHTDLCIENSHKSKTINLQLASTSHDRLKPANKITNTASTAIAPGRATFTAISSGRPTNMANTAVTTSQQLPKHSKPRDKLYRSATHLTVGSRPLFQSVNSYLNFNRYPSGLYSSEQYLDTSRLDNPLRPLENQPRHRMNKRLVTKYSDMEIQKELTDFFKIRPAK